MVAVTEELADSSSAHGTYLDADGPPVEIEELVEYLDDDDLSDGARAAAEFAQIEPTTPDEIPDEAADTISVLDPFGEDNPSPTPPLPTPAFPAYQSQSPSEASRPPLHTTSRAQADSVSSRYSSSGSLFSTSSKYFVLTCVLHYILY